VTIWTRDAVLNLKEDNLSRDVLVPLLTAMGYRDVRFHGGGILEQGRDITMWREDALQRRINVAAIVKAVAITGQSKTTNVIEQLEQAFAAPFRDPANGLEIPIHECFVITPREVRKEGAFTLHNVLRTKWFARYVTIIDGAQLWQYVQEYLGPRATLGAIIENYRRLNTRPGFDMHVQLDGNKTTVSTRSTTGKPITVRMPTFADTMEGQAARESFEHFLRTGEPTVISLAHVTSGFDEGLAQFQGDAREGTVALRSAIPSLRGYVHFRSSSTAAELKGVVLSGYAGTQYLTLTNEAQRLPLTFTIRLQVSPAMDEASFQFAMNSQGRSIAWYVRALDILRAVKEGATITFLESETEIEHGLGFVTADDSLIIESQQHYDIARRIMQIQARTKNVIAVPERGFFTDDDVEDLCIIEGILATGGVDAESITSTFTGAEGQTVDDWLRLFTTTLTDFSITTRMVRRLIDNDIDLGPVRLEKQAVRLSVPDVDAAIESLQAGRDVQVTIVPVDVPTLRLTCPHWVVTPESPQASLPGNEADQ